MNYQECEKLIKRSPMSEYPQRKLANNTYLLRDGDDFVIRLHSTNVVRLKSNGDVVLDSGGWKTQTTKDRIDRYINGYRLFQHKNCWYLASAIVQWYHNEDTWIPFADGMTIHANGSISGEGHVPDKRWLKKIREYAKNYTQALIDGHVSAPSGADCWYCLGIARTMSGEKCNDTEHLKHHIIEKYYVPKLLDNAAAMFPNHLSQVAKSLIWEGWFGGGVDKDWWYINVASEQIANVIKKYLYHEFGIAG